MVDAEEGPELKLTFHVYLAKDGLLDEVVGLDGKQGQGQRELMSRTEDHSSAQSVSVRETCCCSLVIHQAVCSG